jgi:hypothetical protein
MQKHFKNFGFQQVLYPKFNMPIQNLRGALYLPQKAKTILVKGSLFNNATSEKNWFASFLIKKEVYSGIQQYTADQTSANVFPALNENQYKEERGSQTRMASRYSEKKRQKWSQEKDIDDILNSTEEQRDVETGILSIPVQINFEGSQVPFSSVMFKKDDSLQISFLYYHLPSSIIHWINTIVFLLMLFAACAVAIMFQSKVSWKTALFTIALPIILSFLLKRFLDEPLNFDLLIIVGSAFLCFQIAQQLIDRSRKQRVASDKEEATEISGIKENMVPPNTISAEPDGLKE